MIKWRVMTGTCGCRGLSYPWQMGRETILAFGGVGLLLLFLWAAWANMSMTASQAEKAAPVRAAAQSTSCRASQRSFQRTLMAWSISNPGKKPTRQLLQASGLEPPTCPDGGTIEFEGNKVVCSLH